MRTRRCCLVLIATCLAGGCARREAPVFRVDHARAHVDRLAGAIGTRPLGSAANAAARAYLIDQLRLYGFEVRVQEADTSRPDLGLAARVANIIAIKRGERPEVVALVAHYDSVANGPGAMDDGLGTAVSLEAGRVLAARPRPRYSLAVILTDGEEAGLMGAPAIVDDAELRTRVRAYLNLESIGASGPSLLFESGPGNEVLVRAWAAAAPRPRGSSYALEIYKRLPNDTDFTILKRWGVPGLNFSPVGDSHAYHTARDVPERLTSATIEHMGETTVAVVEGLDRVELAVPGATASRDVRFSDVLGRHVVVLIDGQGRLLAVVAVLVGLVAWVRMIGRVWRAGAVHALATLLWGGVSLAAAVGAMLAAVWLLRAAREVYHPWYAHPGRLLALLVVSGAMAPWYVTRLAWLLPERWRYVRAPEAIWALVLLPWCALVAFLEWRAPAAAHVWAIPVLATGLLLTLAPATRPAWLRAASAVALIVSAAFFVPDALLLFPFLVAIFGRLPMVTPFWVYPAFVALIGLMVVPPAVATTIGTLRGRRLQGLLGALLALSLAVTIGLAAVADAYTPADPIRRAVRYVSDQTINLAFWDVSGNEPGLDLDLPGGEASRWRPVEPGTPWPASRPLAFAMRGGAFLFRRDAMPVPAPAVVSARSGTAPGGGAGDIEYEVAALPAHEGVSASLVLPPGVRPSRATPEGAVIRGRWQSTFLALPPTGVSFRLTVPAAAAAALAGAAVIVGTARVPAENGGRPAWLPRARADWAEQAAWIVAPAPAVAVPAPAAAVPAATDLP